MLAFSHCLEKNFLLQKQRHFLAFIQNPQNRWFHIRENSPHLTSERVWVGLRVSKWADVTQWVSIQNPEELKSYVQKPSTPEAQLMAMSYYSLVVHSCITAFICFYNWYGGRGNFSYLNLPIKYWSFFLSLELFKKMNKYIDF